MPDIRPFRGLRYSDDAELALAVAPPYDVIDAAQRAVLAVRPHNAVRLILPEPGAAGDKYAQAAATLAAWRNSGVLALEQEPAFYIYAQTFSFLGGEPVTRAGVIGAVGQGPTIAGHEQTHQGPKDDRFALLSACKTNLSPIFGLAEDPDGALDRAVTAVMESEPAVDFTDGADVRHRVWVDSNQANAGAIIAAVRDTNVVIADGHHRYETSVTYRAEVGGPGSDAVMMLCVSLHSEGLRIYPYHRVLTRAPGESGCFDSAAGWRVESQPADTPWPVIEQRLAELGSEHHAFGLYTREGWQVLAKQRGKAGALDVTVLQREVFDAGWHLDVERLNHDGGLTYTPDGAEAIARVNRGAAAMAVLVNPTPTESVVACARAGQRMPQKSTYFYPKLLTGLVFRPLPDDRS